MWNLRNLSKNCRAVSEVMGQVLIAGITFMALTMVGVLIFAQDDPEYIPHVEVQQRVDASSDVLYLKHSGGESLSLGDLSFIVNIDGSKNVLTGGEITDFMGKNSWNPGDVIEIDLYKTWGIRLDNDDCVDVFIVDQSSKKLIQRSTMYMEGMCSPLMEPGTWYFFSTVDGDDSDEVNLEYLKDCGIIADFSPAALGDSSQDTLLGKDDKDYFDQNGFSHNMKYDPLDLTFGFHDDDFKLPKLGLQNATILMIYGAQSQPVNDKLTIAGENMPVLQGENSGSKNWFIYNRTVPVNISNVSELKFSLHCDQENKDIAIDYLAVCLT